MLNYFVPWKHFYYFGIFFFFSLFLFRKCFAVEFYQHSSKQAFCDRNLDSKIHGFDFFLEPLRLFFKNTIRIHGYSNAELHKLYVGVVEWPFHFHSRLITQNIQCTDATTLIISIMLQ